MATDGSLEDGKLHFISEIYEKFPVFGKNCQQSEEKSGKVGKVGKSREIINLASELLLKCRNASDIKIYRIEILY